MHKDATEFVLDIEIKNSFYCTYKIRTRNNVFRIDQKLVIFWDFIAGILILRTKQ